LPDIFYRDARPPGCGLQEYWYVAELLRNGNYSGQRSRCGKSGNFLERDEMPAVIAFERTGKLRIVKRESYQALIARYDEK
jgi:hypothetical protein